MGTRRHVYIFWTSVDLCVTPQLLGNLPHSITHLLVTLQATTKARRPRKPHTKGPHSEEKSIQPHNPRLQGPHSGEKSRFFRILWGGGGSAKSEAMGRIDSSPYRALVLGFGAISISPLSGDLLGWGWWTPVMYQKTAQNIPK